METDALFPESPPLLAEGERKFIPVAWNEADAVRELLRKRGCPATLCLNPETREARLELWPGVQPEAVLAVLAARQTPPPGGVLPADADKGRRTPSGADAELISV